MIILMYARASANATIRTIDEKCANENKERTRRDETRETTNETKRYHGMTKMKKEERNDNSSGLI